MCLGKLRVRKGTETRKEKHSELVLDLESFGYFFFFWGVVIFAFSVVGGWWTGGGGLVGSSFRGTFVLCVVGVGIREERTTRMGFGWCLESYVLFNPCLQWKCSSQSDQSVFLAWILSLVCSDSLKVGFG